MVSFLSNPKERQCQRMFKIPHTSKVATHSTCLENPMSRGAWQAAVRGVAKSQTGLSLFTFMHWRRKWQPTPVFLSGESQRWGSLVGCRLWGRTGSDTTEATQQQQQEQQSSAQNSQARFQEYVNSGLPNVQAGFRKGRGTRDHITNIHWTIAKAREFQKNIYFCFIDHAKAFDYVGHNKLWKILKEMGIADHLTCLLRNLYASQEQQLEPNMEQQTGSKQGKEYIKFAYCHPAYLTQSTSCKMLGWMKHKLESRLPGEISTTSDMQITPALWQNGKKN